MSKHVILSLIFIIMICLPVLAQNHKEPVSASPVPSQQQTTTVNQVQDSVPMTSIHDIKPPENAGFELHILWYILGTVLIIGIIILGFYLWKNRKKKIKHKTAPSLLPDEAALIELDRLLDVENINGKDFYFQLSAIMRHYIHGRYEINAPEMTTEELLPKIDKLDIDKSLVKPLKTLFQTSDPIKFAGVHSVASAMKKDLAFSIKFVKDTTQKKIDSLEQDSRD